MVEIQILWSDSETEKNKFCEWTKVGKSNANVPGARAQQKRQPRNKNDEKYETSKNS